MKVDLFDYALPPELIAKYPPQSRDAGRLLVLERATGGLNDHTVRDLPELIGRGAVLVINDTRVIPARLRARRPTGGFVEVLLVRGLEQTPESCRWLALARANKPLRPGSALDLGGIQARVAERGAGRGEVELEIEASPAQLKELWEEHGEIPLPPYLKRKADDADKTRYQTVFARREGSVAAPTASLHFTKELLAKLQAGGVTIAEVTLHVGPGTFRPITASDTREHVMDEEFYEIDESTAEVLRSAKREGRPVIAVGTTVTRALEGAAAQHGELRACRGMTGIFIEPGYPFQVIDGLMTNFHLPRSTLLCLVSALAGRENVLYAYSHAVDQRYRFYSYGDAMLIRPDSRMLNR